MWYYSQQNEVIGPLSHQEIGTLLMQGVIDAFTPVWHEGLADWIILRETKLSDLLPPGTTLGSSQPGETTFSRGSAPASHTQPHYRIPSGPPPSPLRGVAPSPRAFKGETAFKLRSMWLAMLLSGGVGVLISITGGVLAATGRENDLAGVGSILLFAYFIIALLLIGKFWTIIAGDIARTTPRRAAYLLLIPIFNFYWLFISVYGLSKDINRYCAVHRVAAKPVNQTLALIFCIFNCLNFIPVVGIFTFLGAFVISFILWKSFVETSVAIIEGSTRVGGRFETDSASSDYAIDADFDMQTENEEGRFSSSKRSIPD